MTVLGQLIAFFAGLSLVAVGGAPAILPELQRATVDQHHWMTAEQFTSLFAISQAAPGPNILIVALIGWQVAGVPAAVLSLLAFLAPCSVLAFLVGTVWSRFAESVWRARLAAALAPLAIGMITASGIVIARSADAHSLRLVGATLLSALVVWRTRLNPLVPLGVGALLGAVQLI